MLFLLLRRGCDCQPRGDLRLRDFPVGVGANFRQLVHQDHEGQNQRERRMEVGRGAGSILCQLEWEPTLRQLVHQDHEGQNQRERRVEVKRGQVVFSASWSGSQPSASWYIRTMKVRTREKGEWKWRGGKAVK